MRLALLLILLSTFVIAPDNGSCVDPDGRQCRGSSITVQIGGVNRDAVKTVVRTK
jgi:hypothetical protein